MNTTKKIVEMIESQKRFGKVTDTAPLSGGLINQTFLVKTDCGKFVVQQVNPSAGKQSVIDYIRLEDKMRKNFMHIPFVFLVWQDEDDRLWKMTEYIEHSKSAGLDDATARNAAKYMAKVHHALESCPLVPNWAIPGFHDSPAILAKLDRLDSNSKEVTITELAKLIASNGKNYSIPDEPRRLIHGDPKLDNFLFDRNRDVVALIDWETLMIGQPLIDIGDMMRSFCKGDDDAFDARRFRIMSKAYNYVAQGGLTEDVYSENEILSATKLITLELAARFLIDWFEDSYFGWDSAKFTSRKESNLTAARKYFAYFQTMS